RERLQDRGRGSRARARARQELRQGLSGTGDRRDRPRGFRGRPRGVRDDADDGRRCVTRGERPGGSRSLRRPVQGGRAAAARRDLGIAYVQADAYAEAVSELELAEKRRGERTAMCLDDWPTVHQLATLQYWLGRAHEGLGATPAARQNYQSFIKLRGGAADP